MKALSSQLSLRKTFTADTVFQQFLQWAGIGIALLLALMLFKLLQFSLPAIQAFGFKFFITNQWEPITEEYGALAFIYGTLVSSLIALLIACPISIGTALFICELAPRKIAQITGFLVEMLAAIPSVVYGLWGIFVLVPLMRVTIEPFLGETLGFLPLFQGPPYGIGMLTAGIVLAIMITPTITSISREVFQTVPDSEKEAVLALGATKWESIKVAILKSSGSGVMVAIILGLGRALGETMAVTMVIGNRSDISFSLFDPAQTMASLIANEYSEATSDLHLSALVAVGLTLFFIALVTNTLARLISWKMRSRGKFEC